MSHAVQGHPRWMGHSEEFWWHVVHWRKKWQPTPVFLPEEPHGQFEKVKRYDAGRWGSPPPPRLEGVQCATGEQQRAITNSSRSNEVAGPKQKLLSVVDVSGTEKSNSIWYRTILLGLWIKVNWMWLSRRWQDGTLTSEESMDENGQI